MTRPTGVYKTYLWDLEEAESFFNQSIQLASEDFREERVVKAEAFLAFVKAQIGQRRKGLQLANSSYMKIMAGKYGDIWEFSFYLWILGRTYKTLGYLEQSMEAYQNALSDKMHIYFAQAEARIISGVAEVDCERFKYEEAIFGHLKAIRILEKVGANCDLPEVYYQLGISYRQIGEVDKSRTSFCQSIQLFENMKAPNQIARVKQSLSML
ncbi:MAG: hypothetical protein AB4042_11860 [Leptolyngbyaceae cyanobacterium]